VTVGVLWERIEKSAHFEFPQNTDIAASTVRKESSQLLLELFEENEHTV
jgi:hypothetical protein